MYFQSIHQKMHHLTTAEYDDFTSIILHARKVNKITKLYFLSDLIRLGTLIYVKGHGSNFREKGGILADKTRVKT